MPNISDAGPALDHFLSKVGPLSIQQCTITFILPVMAAPPLSSVTSFYMATTGLYSHRLYSSHSLRTF